MKTVDLGHKDRPTYSENVAMVFADCLRCCEFRGRSKNCTDDCHLNRFVITAGIVGGILNTFLEMKKAEMDLRR